MRKADYIHLAMAVRGVVMAADMLAARHQGNARAEALREAAQAIAHGFVDRGASVDRVEFLKACGVNPD